MCGCGREEAMAAWAPATAPSVSLMITPSRLQQWKCAHAQPPQAAEQRDDPGGRWPDRLGRVVEAAAHLSREGADRPWRGSEPRQRQQSAGQPAARLICPYAQQGLTQPVPEQKRPQHGQRRQPIQRQVAPPAWPRPPTHQWPSRSSRPRPECPRPSPCPQRPARSPNRGQTPEGPVGCAPDPGCASGVSVARRPAGPRNGQPILHHALADATHGIKGRRVPAPRARPALFPGGSALPGC
jgi:hypothetical protein